MKIIFRTDASVTIGQGHVRRSLTLADTLREQGASAGFVCREHDAHLCDLIEGKGFDLSRLPTPKPGVQSDDTSAHASWLGSLWEDDAEQTRCAIKAQGTRPDWLVVDHYAIDQRWESALRGFVRRIMVIDDLADRSHDCDLLLDQNLVGDMLTRYAGRVPAACGLLLGPEYALLDPSYAELRARACPRNEAIRRILIFFGGVDTDNLTGRALSAVLDLNMPNIEIDVVTTGSGPHYQTFLHQIAGHTNIRLHRDLPTLAPLMAQADLAIGAGGSTSWERLCMGLPTLVVTVAENQLEVARELDRRGLIRWLGGVSSATFERFQVELLTILNSDSNAVQSRHMGNIVDGRGASRVCEAMHSRVLRGTVCS